MKHDTVSWTWDMRHGVAEIFLYTLSQWNTTAELHFLGMGFYVRVGEIVCVCVGCMCECVCVCLFSMYMI